MIFILASVLALASPTSPPPPPPPPCRGDDLAIALGGKDGDFNGMSHSGTSMVVRLRGHSACLLAGLPTVTFLDDAGRPLPIERRAPPGMHPGPVVVPVRLEPGVRATTALRWVSGDVYENGRCFEPASVRITVRGHAVTLPFNGRICGEAASPVTFEQAPLQRAATVPAG